MEKSLNSAGGSVAPGTSSNSTRSSLPSSTISSNPFTSSSSLGDTTNSEPSSSASSSSTPALPSYPLIIVTGVTTTLQECQKILASKGFILKYSLQESSESILVLEISPKLHIKLAIEHDYPVVNRHLSADGDVTRITSISQQLLKKSGIQYAQSWLMNQPEKVAALSNKTPAGLDLNGLNNYFGSQIALYFGWMSFYCNYLKIPAIFGAILFSHQLFYGQVDDAWNPFYMFLIAFWGIIFLEYWKQRNASLAYSWGVFDADEERRLAYLLQAPNKEKSLWKKISKYMVTIPLMIVMLALLIAIMIFFLHMMNSTQSIFGIHSFLQYLPIIIYSFIPAIAGYLFDQVVVLLNDLENHSPEQEESALIMKQFIFQFINRYCALLYAAFYLRDLDKLRTLLASLLITNALIENILEIFTPTLAKMGLTWRNKQKMKNGSTSVKFTLSSTGKSWIESLTTSQADELWKVAILDEIRRDEYSLRSDYMEMMIQFGYITMFGVVFPLAPALALINNMMEIKVDFIRLSHCRRPDVIDRSSLNGWFTCLSVLSVTSIFTNSFLLCIVSNQWSSLVPPNYLPILQTEFSRIIVMVVLEHTLLAMKLLLSHLIEELPRWVQEKKAQEAERVRKQLAVERLTGYRIQDPPSEDSEKNAEKDVERNAAAAKISKLRSPFGYSPTLLLPLLTAPTWLSFLNLPLYLYGPLAMSFLAYIKSDKDKQDNLSARGIIGDPNIRRLVEEELPSWIKHSDSDRAQWLNDFLAKLWPYISRSTEGILRSIPLESYYSSLKFTDITLGSVPLTILAVKYCQTEENCVRLDLNIKWAGNPKIGLTIGTSKHNLLELADITFTGLVRVELGPLFPRFPCFGAIDVTFLEKPFIDFSLKVVSFDVMNIGLDELNTTALINSIIRSQISSMMLYPHKYHIPIAADQDIQSVSTRIPVGLLKLTIVSASGLKPVESMSSDPYVQFTVCGTENKTQVVKNSIAPTWNETFHLMIFDKQQDILEFIVLDDDVTSLTNKTFGYGVLPLDSILPFEVVSKDLTLETEEERAQRLKAENSKDSKSSSSSSFSPINLMHKIVDTAANNSPIKSLTDSAKLQRSKSKTIPKLLVDCEYSPLKRNGDESTSPMTDILYDLSPANLTNELLAEEVTLVSQQPINNFAAVVMEEQRLRKTQIKSMNTPLSLHSGVLTVSGIRGKNFKIDSSFTASTLRPYLIFSVGTVKYRTGIQKDYSNPYYPESFNFIVHDPMSTVLLVKVLHDNILKGDTLLGEVSIRLHEVAKHHGSVDREYPLASKYEEMSISCRLQWSATM